MSDAAPLLFLLVLLGVFWFLIMRPARVQQRQVREVQGALEPGQRVVLSAGVFGTVRSLSDTEAEVEIAPGTVVTVLRQVIVRRVDEPVAASSSEEPVVGTSEVPDDPADLDRRPGGRD